MAKQKATSPPIAANAMATRQPDEGSGAFIRRLLKAGMDDAAILAAVHSQFDGSKASKSDINWNKGKLKKEEGWAPGASPKASVAPDVARQRPAPKASPATPQPVAPRANGDARATARLERANVPSHIVEAAVTLLEWIGGKR